MSELSYGYQVLCFITVIYNWLTGTGDFELIRGLLAEL